MQTIRRQSLTHDAAFLPLIYSPCYRSRFNAFALSLLWHPEIRFIRMREIFIESYQLVILKYLHRRGKDFDAHRERWLHRIAAINRDSFIHLISVVIRKRI